MMIGKDFVDGCAVISSVIRFFLFSLRAERQFTHARRVAILNFAFLSSQRLVRVWLQIDWVVFNVFEWRNISKHLVDETDKENP